MSPLYTLAPVALPSDRIAWLLKFYFNRICHEAFRDPAADPLFGPGWRRMYRLIQRLTRLALKWQRGTLPTPRAPRAPRARATARPERATARDLLPRGNCKWMRDQFPRMMPPFAGAILRLCQDELVMALVAAAPQSGRILRPMCRMIGLKPPTYLQLPPRPRRPRHKAAPKPRPPRKVDINRMSAVAWGKFVHPDHPGQHHPPARIGYGGSWWPPKRK